MATRAQRIQDLIKQGFPSLQVFELEDESHKHAGRAGQESHFKLLLVCDSLQGQNRVQRQRSIHSLLKDEFEAGLHALSMRLLTMEEYQKQTQSFQSPDCQGSKS